MRFGPVVGRATVHQLVPVNNYVPLFLKPAFTLSWSRPAAALALGGHTDTAYPHFRCPGRTPAVRCSETPSPPCKWTAAAPRCFSSSRVARLRWTKFAACRSVDRPDAETAHSAPVHRRVLSRRPGTTEGMSKGMGRWATERHLSAADERFGLRLGAGLIATLVAAQPELTRAAEIVSEAVLATNVADPERCRTTPPGRTASACRPFDEPVPDESLVVSRSTHDAGGCAGGHERDVDFKSLRARTNPTSTWFWVLLCVTGFRLTAIGYCVGHEQWAGTWSRGRRDWRERRCWPGSGTRVREARGFDRDAGSWRGRAGCGRG